MCEVGRVRTSPLAFLSTLSTQRSAELWGASNQRHKHQLSSVGLGVVPTQIGRSSRERMEANR